MSKYLTAFVGLLMWTTISVSVYSQNERTMSTTIQQQQQVIQQSSAITSTSTLKAEPTNYIYKCEMYDGRIFYVMPNDNIMGYNTNNELKHLGYKEKPPRGREKEFAYMVTILEPYITYAVDSEGHVWQKKYPFKEIVGEATVR